MNNQSVEELFAQAKEGDSHAFGSIYDSYFSQIFRYVYYRTKQRELAEDLVQTVFIKVFARIEEIDNTHPKAYLFTVARNTLTDHWRKKKELSMDAADLSRVGASSQIETQLSDHQDIDRILHVLDQLPADQQDVILLKFVHDLPNSEIAIAMGKNEATVRQLQSRGLRALRTLLNP